MDVPWVFKDRYEGSRHGHKKPCSTGRYSFAPAKPFPRNIILIDRKKEKRTLSGLHTNVPKIHYVAIL